MKNEEKIDNRENFTKLTHKRGISLIVLIVTVIVIIILAAAVILTISNDNPVSSAKEATFKEDMVNIQDDLAMYISKKYTDNSTSFDKSSVNLSGDTMITELPSTKKYKDKVSVNEGNLVWIGKTENNTERKWFTEVTGNTSNSEAVKEDWKNTIAEEKDGVPIPKGFQYKEGTKDTGLVIKDSNDNEFVWVPATVETYVEDFSFPSLYQILPSYIRDDALPNGIDETADVKKYGGFYIGRYEAGVPENQTTIDGKSSSTSNVEGIPVSKKSATVWTNINYTNAKASAEKMISNEYVQTGLITGKAWDRTCYWIEDCLENIDELASLTDSRYYGNYMDSTGPAKDGIGSVRTAGFNENWKTKNIYDLAGNVYEWTTEVEDYNTLARGGCCYGDGDVYPVSFRALFSNNDYDGDVGFRIRLYIK